MTLIIFGLTILYVDITLKNALLPTIKEVKKTFTDVIEKIEPGSLKREELAAAKTEGNDLS